ncbi:MAG: 4-hydroxy-3-methylbut-2-enyl diphosphate reductase [Gammaproteobacteria bacterium]|nr:MAG: 4-hydroxy-3-methylbut-2-enyl diphosphate reductase [Gammaproteobacteria bacterium]
MQIVLANPRGFCAGVDRAIAIVERALEAFGAPIHVRHEVVHNRFVVAGLEKKGAIFVDDLDDVPDGAIVIFSAHGVPQSVRLEAKRRELRVFDATCPLVTKVHLEVSRHQEEVRDCILIGHAGHPEVEGTLGQCAQTNGGGRMYLVETTADVQQLEVRAPENLAFVTQTTLSMDDTANVIAALRARFPKIKGPRKDDICYATQNRQDAVKQMAPDCDVFVVVGSPNSSNSNRLRELAFKLGTPAYLVDAAEQLEPEWFDGARKVGVTAGASAPEALVEAVLSRLEHWGGEGAEETPGKSEKVTFSLPKGLECED